MDHNDYNENTSFTYPTMYKEEAHNIFVGIGSYLHKKIGVGFLKLFSDHQ